MAFDWAEYLEVAAALHREGVQSPRGGEARSRSAVSRAYYGVFGRARVLLRPLVGSHQRRSSHEHRRVASVYTGSADPRLRPVGHTLERLRMLRNACDYDDLVPNLGRRVVEALDEADRAIRLLVEV